MVAEANRSHLGLLAYVFSRDPERANRIAERIEAGTVMINDVIAAHAMAETPWAGVKQSGIGSTHGDDALRQMCQQRHVNEDVLPWMERELWWYPYRSADLPMLERSIRGLYASGVWGKLRGVLGRN
jgi:succinate-semialdehyde dehydrogenase/glutarate-semialdehyde dehydrogenase